MPQSAIEQIDEVRGGERSIWFAGVKGFLLTLVREAIPTIIIGTIAGGIIAGAAMVGMEVLHWGDVLKEGSEYFLKEGGTLGYIGSVALTSGALSGILVGAKGAYNEISHARSINHLIDMEVQHAKGVAKSRFQQPQVAAEGPSYLQTLVEKGAEAHPKTHISRLLEERKAAELASKDITIH